MAATSYSLTGQTISNFTKTYDGNAQRITPQGTIITKRFDAAAVLAAMKTVLSTKAFEQNDVWAVLPVAKGQAVKWVSVNVLTAATAAATIEVGDSTDSDGFIAAFAVNATGQTNTTNASALLGVGTTPTAWGVFGKAYTADNYISIKSTHASNMITGLVLEISAEIVDMSISI